MPMVRCSHSVAPRGSTKFTCKPRYLRGDRRVDGQLTRLISEIYVMVGKTNQLHTNDHPCPRCYESENAKLNALLTDNKEIVIAMAMKQWILMTRSLKSSNHLQPRLLPRAKIATTLTGAPNKNKWSMRSTRFFKCWEHFTHGRYVIVWDTKRFFYTVFLQKEHWCVGTEHIESD